MMVVVDDDNNDDNDDDGGGPPAPGADGAAAPGGGNPPQEAPEEEPQDLVQVGLKLAELQETTLERVAKMTTANLLSLLNPKVKLSPKWLIP